MDIVVRRLNEAGGACAAGIRDGFQVVAGIIGKRGLVIHRIRHRSAIALRVVNVDGKPKDSFVP